MNSLIVVILSLVLFAFGYFIYAKKLETLWEIDAGRTTPAISKHDGVDFVAVKHWLVLFGHHFASIAGAGPIIGPVIACVLWGWVPALLWVVLGTIFIGGVHDFGALITSVREGGSSVADISQDVLSRRAKILFSLFVWLALILVIAVFTYLCAKTFVDEPKIVIPSLGVIPVAIIVGYLLYRLKLNLGLVTLFGLTSLLSLIIWGQNLPVYFGKNSIIIWTIVLLVYSYIASVVPVNILLQPRDYLSSYLLFGGVGLGYLGMFLMRPEITAPAFVQFNSQEGLLWPMMFVTIACGAVSGFHSLIASGTTSKQIANEREIKKIGYGAMVAEGVVAVLAVLAITCAFGNKNLGSELKRLGPITMFGQGYGYISQNILAQSGSLIAITILNAFILTTLDTATRISRYITEELFKFKNRYISTLIIVSVSGTLALSGKWNKIWPAFGASNQLVAALALFVISSWLLCHKKPAKITLYPAIFMLITTVAALIYQIVRYLKNKDYLLLFVSSALIILAMVMVVEVFQMLKKNRCISHA